MNNSKVMGVAFEILSCGLIIASMRIACRGGGGGGRGRGER